MTSLSLEIGPDVVSWGTFRPAWWARSRRRDWVLRREGGGEMSKWEVYSEDGKVAGSHTLAHALEGVEVDKTYMRGRHRYGGGQWPAVSCLYRCRIDSISSRSH